MLSVRTARPVESAASFPAVRAGTAAAGRPAPLPRVVEPAIKPIPKLVDLQSGIRKALKLPRGEPLQGIVRASEAPNAGRSRWWKPGLAGLAFLALTSIGLVGVWLGKRRRSAKDAQAAIEMDGAVAAYTPIDRTGAFATAGDLTRVR